MSREDAADLLAAAFELFDVDEAREALLDLIPKIPAHKRKQFANVFLENLAVNVDLMQMAHDQKTELAALVPSRMTTDVALRLLWIEAGDVIEPLGFGGLVEACAAANLKHGEVSASGKDDIPQPVRPHWHDPGWTEWGLYWFAITWTGASTAKIIAVDLLRLYSVPWWVDVALISPVPRRSEDVLMLIREHGAKEWLRNLFHTNQKDILDGYSVKRGNDQSLCLKLDETTCSNPEINVSSIDRNSASWKMFEKLQTWASRSGVEVSLNKPSDGGSCFQIYLRNIGMPLDVKVNEKGFPTNTPVWVKFNATSIDKISANGVSEVQLLLQPEPTSYVTEATDAVVNKLAPREETWEDWAEDKAFALDMRAFFLRTMSAAAVGAVYNTFFNSASLNIRGVTNYRAVHLIGVLNWAATLVALFQHTYFLISSIIGAANPVAAATLVFVLNLMVGPAITSIVANVVGRAITGTLSWAVGGQILADAVKTFFWGPTAAYYFIKGRSFPHSSTRRIEQAAWVYQNPEPTEEQAARSERAAEKFIEREQAAEYFKFRGPPQAMPKKFVKQYRKAMAEEEADLKVTRRGALAKVKKSEWEVGQLPVRGRQEAEGRELRNDRTAQDIHIRGRKAEWDEELQHFKAQKAYSDLQRGRSPSGSRWQGASASAALSALAAVGGKDREAAVEAAARLLVAQGVRL